MYQQGPIIVVSHTRCPPFAAALGDAKVFPVIDATWAEASGAIAQLEPAAVLVEMLQAPKSGLEVLAKQIAASRPYLPLIAADPTTSLPENAIPFSQMDTASDRLIMRLRAALRIRTLHATVLRRLDHQPVAGATRPDTDLARNATVLLIGRGKAYPALSVALGERLGVVGALSIEAAAKHLNVRDIDGIVLAEGFSLRVIDAFLTVLSEDARFRSLPIVLTSDALEPAYDLPNLEIIAGEPERVAANALPLIRQHAFEAQLGRTLRSIDAGGLLDPRTGLLTPNAFHRDFATALYQTLSRGGGLSVARFTFESGGERALLDGARILSRLMRQMDFGAVQEDGSILVAFVETDLRTAQIIVRRLSSVMRHTSQGSRETRIAPEVALATLLPSDTLTSLLGRLNDEGCRAAS